jgi:hypothetical protein
MTECVEKLIRGGTFDLAHMDSIHMCSYAGGIARKVAYNWHNIESEAMLRYSETRTFAVATLVCSRDRSKARKSRAADSSGSFRPHRLQ